MRVLGRLLLLAVGGVLLYLSISSIISNWSTIQTIGWDTFFTKDTWNAVSSILGQVLKAICGLHCVFLALRGKSTFISFIVAAVLIAAGFTLATAVDPESRRSVSEQLAVVQVLIYNGRFDEAERMLDRLAERGVAALPERRNLAGKLAAEGDETGAIRVISRVAPLLKTP